MRLAAPRPWSRCFNWGRVLYVDLCTQGVARLREWIWPIHVVMRYEQQLRFKTRPVHIQQAQTLCGFWPEWTVERKLFAGNSQL